MNLAEQINKKRELEKSPAKVRVKRTFDTNGFLSEVKLFFGLIDERDLWFHPDVSSLNPDTETIYLKRVFFRKYGDLFDYSNAWCTYDVSSDYFFYDYFTTGERKQRWGNGSETIFYTDPETEKSYLWTKAVELKLVDKINNPSVAKRTAYNYLPYEVFWTELLGKPCENGFWWEEKGLPNYLVVDSRFFKNALAILEYQGFVIKKLKDDTYSCSLP